MIETVQEYATALAAEIRRYGHWQNMNTVVDESDPRQRPYSGLDAGQLRCVIFSDAWSKIAPSKVITIEKQLAKLVGSKPRESITVWNDNTPTEEVLAKLDEIAAS